MPPLEALESAIQALVQEYQDLNASHAAELHSTPTPLEFSRFVASNRPLVIRGEGQRQRIAALEKWTNAYLATKVESEVTVAASPTGRADAVEGDYFVEPASVNMTIATLFDRLDESARDPSAPVWYLQSQNGNLSGQLEPLAADVGNGPAWATEIFGELPDVANVWIGSDRSVTSMHKDPYENIYLMVRGTKTFTLLPPTEFYCLHEGEYKSATYKFQPPSTFTLSPAPPNYPSTIPWIPVDPTNPDLTEFPRFAHARPMTVTLHKGDMLYLPALWFHHVAQSSGASPDPLEKVEAAIAVNWWTDMRMDSLLWSAAQFIRKTTLMLDGRVESEI